MKHCRRCGRNFKISISRKAHSVPCRKVPIPSELSELWHSDSLSTSGSLAYYYDVSRSFIVSRLVLGGITSEEQLTRGKHVRTCRPKPRFKRNLDFKLPKLPICRCGILLQSNEGLCSYCVAESFGLITFQQRQGLAPRTQIIRSIIRNATIWSPFPN